MPRRKFPSDHRPWFRVLEEILDDPVLTSVSLEKQMVFIRVLAMLHRAQSRDGVLTLSGAGIKALTKRSREPDAAKILTQLDASFKLASRGLRASSPLALSYVGASYVLTAPNWAILQGFAPAKLRPIEKSRVEESRSTPIAPSETIANPEDFSLSADEPPAPATKEKRKKPKRPFPPDGLSAEQKLELMNRPEIKARGYSKREFRLAEAKVRTWAEGEGATKVSWPAAIANAMLDGWALRESTDSSARNLRPRESEADAARDREIQENIRKRVAEEAATPEARAARDESARVARESIQASLARAQATRTPKSRTSQQESCGTVPPVSDDPNSDIEDPGE